MKTLFRKILVNGYLFFIEFKNVHFFTHNEWPFEHQRLFLFIYLFINRKKTIFINIFLKIFL